jgi:membrane carboxypeptidase/penicillin-binding protein PbpC
MRHILGQLRGLGWLSPEVYQLALDAPLTLRHERSTARARHFIDHLLLSVPEELRRGARVEATLDLALQEQLEVATRRHLANVGSRGVTQAGVVVIDNRSGEILAMVGSSNYADTASHGAVNVTTLPRRAGSTLKPFVYALALERGDSPATLAHDVVLPGEAGETYTADVRQHGFARYREALAGSYNLAAVHTLEKVGVQSLVDRLRLAGVSTLREPSGSYGLDLAIGDAEIRLIEYAGAFAAFGNEGRAVRPRSARRIVSAEGDPVARREAEAAVRVFSPAIAHQIFDILADPDARRPMFGRTAPLELGFPVALKTGTTRGYTDNLAFGTTREFTVGAWAGNFDGTPMEGVMAMQGAAPRARGVRVARRPVWHTDGAAAARRAHHARRVPALRRTPRPALSRPQARVLHAQRCARLRCGLSVQLPRAPAPPERRRGERLVSAGARAMGGSTRPRRPNARRSTLGCAARDRVSPAGGSLPARSPPPRGGAGAAASSAAAPRCALHDRRSPGGALRARAGPARHRRDARRRSGRGRNHVRVSERPRLGAPAL